MEDWFIQTTLIRHRYKQNQQDVGFTAPQTEAEQPRVVDHTCSSSLFVMPGNILSVHGYLFPGPALLSVACSTAQQKRA